jgi:hypothetical protein
VKVPFLCLYTLTERIRLNRGLIPRTRRSLTLGIGVFSANIPRRIAEGLRYTSYCGISVVSGLKKILALKIIHTSRVYCSEGSA